jgi:hypothetical protein
MLQTRKLEVSRHGTVDVYGPCSMLIKDAVESRPHPTHARTGNIITLILHLLPQSLDLFLQLLPENVVTEIALSVSESSLLVRPSNNDQQCSDEGLLHIRKGKITSDISKPGGHLWWKFHLLVVSQLVTPILAVLDSFFASGYIEQVLPVESTWSLGNSWVQLLKMVRASNHQDSVVRFQPVNFVEEVASHHGTNERVDVFEHEETWCHSSSHEKYLAYAVFWPLKAVESLHVERFDCWGGSLAYVVHKCLGGDSFPILRGTLSVYMFDTIRLTYPWWTVEYHASLE